MSDLNEAFDDWRAAKRDLEATTPGTAPWLRAHMIEEQRRLAYRAAADAMEREVLADPGQPFVSRPTGTAG